MADSGTADAGAADGGAADGPIVRIPVTGELAGMWDGASLTVRLQGAGVDDQRVTLGANGGFAFPVELPEGTPFVATVESSPALHTCTVDNHLGRAWQGTPPVQITCAGPALQIELSNPDGFHFDPMTRSYDLAYSFLTHEQLVRVVGADGLDVQLEGSSLALGAWMSIPLGDAPVTTHLQVGEAGISLSFQLTFRRGARALAQAVYAKSLVLDQLGAFGSDVALSGDTLVAANGALLGFGDATVYRRTGATWAAEQLVLRPEGGFDDFGVSVAVSGDTLVIGAPFSNWFVSGSGAVFVYRRGFLGWALEAALGASNAERSDDFGRSIAIDGDTIVVGAPGEDSAATGVNGTAPGPDDNSQSASGAAYVFRRSGTSWTQEAYLKASNTGANDGFGHSVAISGDTVTVSATGEDSAATGVNGTAPGQDDNSMASAGAVYVFRRSDTSWAQEAYVKASNPGASDLFGDSVALSGDTLVVGASGEDSAATGVDGTAPGPDDNSKLDSGAAYVFHRTNGAWAQQAYLKPSNTGAGDNFGQSVAVWLDTVVVGAHFEDGGGRGVNPASPGPDDDSKLDSGAIYVFRRGSTWHQEAYVKSANSDAGDRFGNSVAVGPDTIAAGAPFEASGSFSVDSDNSLIGAGAAYIFR
ncbi:MAG TPA: FG-GAP repeat protein [Kofleriaceae bacterium]|nr:FG-GAP repeat protein [Kofleriaceae bacterium]